MFNNVTPAATNGFNNANLNDITMMTRDQSSIDYPKQPVIQKYNKDRVYGNGQDFN